MEFKQWLNESVTFTVKGHTKEQIENIYYLATTIDRDLRRTLGSAYQTQKADQPRLDMDGLDVDAQEGNLNFYAGDLSAAVIKKAVAAIQYFVKEHQAQITGPVKQDISRMFKVPVYRIPVKLAKMTEDRPPEMNVSNANAAVILQDILNQPSDDVDGGSISARELLMKLGSVSDFAKQMTMKAPSKEVGKGGATFYDGGVSEQQIERYLSTLEKMARWAIEHNYDEIVWG